MSKSDLQYSNFKPLPLQFEGKGEVKDYTFTQINMTDKAFIFEVSSGQYKHYEVFKKFINTRYSCISYPKSNAFGIWAWDSRSLEAAYKKFNELNSCD